MVIHGQVMSETAVSLRIVSPPPAGASEVAVATAPKLYVVNAGRIGLIQNEVDRANQVGLNRNVESATGSPNTPTAVGSAGTAGFTDTGFPVRQIPTNAAITSPNGAMASAVYPSNSKQQWPKWLFVVGGIAIGWVVFRG